MAFKRSGVRLPLAPPASRSASQSYRFGRTVVRAVACARTAVACSRNAFTNRSRTEALGHMSPMRRAKERPWHRQFGERQAPWPWRRPVRQERYSEPSINHDGDRVKLVDLEEFSWPYPGFAEIVVHEASWPNFTIQSDKRLGRQDGVRFSRRCRRSCQHNQRLFSQHSPSAALRDCKRWLCDDCGVEIITV